ncbi:MAG: hypothetical protein Ct9H300mP28_32750 [Pseudomonadota bacterium]|nr:MAG: hypothetical protein Ct9H300mP28_32750 [Pseudomonadota bacterium]
MIEEADVLIDAIFGMGMEQSIEGAYREWIEIFNSNKSALKICSGYSFRGFYRRKQDSWSGSTMSSHNYFSGGKTRMLSVPRCKVFPGKCDN